MANHKSAKKATRKIATRSARNRARVSRIRTFIKKVEEAIVANNSEAAKTAFVNMQSEIMRGVTKGVIKKNTASRKVSRLAARIKAIA
jgi:small subunit ribosomal protein S20